MTAPSVIGSAALAALPGSMVPDATMGVAVDARHVLGVGGVVDRSTARLAALIDPGFLAGAGWDTASRVLSVPPGHPLLGWSVCQTARCTNQVYGGHRTCGACRAGQDEPLADDTGVAEPAQRCQVEACPRDRRNRRYCRAHYERLLDQRRRDPGFDERRWRRLEPAIENSGQVSLHGIPGPVVVQVLYGLQQRTREGTKTGVATLRQVGWELRRLQPESVEHVAVQARREHHKLVSCFARHVRRAFLRPETERVKDVWDLVAFGLSGRLDFTKISQPWLREAAKRWAADDLPRRRGKATAGPVQHYLVSLAALSEGLRAARPDRGDAPNALGRSAIEAFLHRLAFLVADDQVSTDARTRICREVKHLLGRIRSLGLTRPGGPAAGLGEDFTLSTGDIPVKPEDPEANRDLPAEIMQALCRQLPALELAVSCREIRVAVELVIDTGRRPDEICSLVWDCLEYDEHDRLPVLIYDNHKSARLGRRLPIAQATAELITAQKDRVRAQFPDTPLAELKLLPAAYSNPHGRRAVTETQLTTRHRVWIKSLPPVLRADGTEYDKSKIVPYAYRHTYAQRHADAGVPIDVLATLMDHRSLNTTKHYYRVGEARRRDAVDRVTALQFDRHGNRLWRTVQNLLDTEQARRGIGEVAVPYGICGEPSNVKAGGHACPYRFRCVGCDHFRTDISYLPDLQAYLDDLLRTREKLLAASDVDDWARQEATPSTEEVTRIRRLIARINTGLDELTADQRDQVEQAVAVVRRHRTVLIGMPRIRQTMLDVHPERTA
ncbi:MAG TPA: tyrosine-type recombinase/integrase [Mycobacterium sp.]